MKRKILARKFDILEFIARRKMVWSYELVERFGSSEKTVPKLLYRLQKAGLVEKIHLRALRQPSIMLDDVEIARLEGIPIATYGQ